MFYIVPHNRSIVKAIAKTETFDKAVWIANDLKRQNGENYEVIMQTRCWSTQTLDKAHLAALNVPHMARD